MNESGEIKVLKGHAIWLESAEDCELLRRVCILPQAWNLLSELAQGTLKKSDVEYLHNTQFKEFSSIITSWEKLTFDATSQPTDGPEENLAKLDQGSGLIQLCVALGVLRQIWKKDPQGEMLRAVLNVPETIGGETKVSTEGAVLVLQPGSLDAFIGWNAAYQASKWLLGLWIRRGRVPSQIADDIVRGLRDRAAIDRRPLRTVTDVQPDEVGKALGVIIFIHGLMSTDAGLFDELLVELEDNHPTFKQRCLLLGFPHDTFVSIKANAQMLVDKIDYLFWQNSKTLLAFVCHSRGGLLARQVAVNLFQVEQARWKEQLAGCVTFGTPHKGTPLAEYPSKLLGAGVSILGGIQRREFMGASDVLALVAAYGGRIPGIDDQKPPTAIASGPEDTTFVGRLRDAERSLALQHGCLLSTLAIGGQGPHENRIAWITDKLFRNVPNDCVVELSSSAPEQVVGVIREEVECDHFSYFERALGFSQAISFLKKRLKYPPPEEPGTREPKEPPKAMKPILRETYSPRRVPGLSRRRSG